MSIATQPGITPPVPGQEKEEPDFWQEDDIPTDNRGKGKASDDEALIFGLSPRLPADGSGLPACSVEVIRHLARDCLRLIESGFDGPWLLGWSAKVRAEIAGRGLQP